MTPQELEATLAERGWLAIQLPDPSPVMAVRDALLARLRAESLPDLERLDDYHTLVTEDERHVAILHDLATYYWERQLGRTIIEGNLDLFRRLVGPDLHVQQRPYLRAVRPGHTKDAAPLHRDTYYGASPYEVSVLVPFTKVDAEGAMRVISGSHLAADREFPFEQRQSPDVAIRSPKHQLGFPYAPKVLEPALMDKAEPVPLEVGQALIFGLSLVHGGGINTGHRTRFSTDIRVANSLAPVQWSRGVNESYFVPLCTSVITESARRYLAANDSTPP
jgi:hypothetical protein